jgi:hypothetical protein|tara:strand:- start:5173 stop:5469 length:297 start_codon:yes stop_codon:yes gene_type:complete
MKISELAHKPKLINIVVDDQEVQELYNDAIEFWCYDRQPLNKFVKFANMSEDTYPELIDFCQDLILDEDGNKVLDGEKVLPTKILLKCVNKVVEQLGK